VKDCDFQGSSNPRPQFEPSKNQPTIDQPTANQAVRQSRWPIKKACFQTATAQDQEDQSNSQDEDFTNANTDVDTDKSSKN
jgi:hypothetical protein